MHLMRTQCDLESVWDRGIDFSSSNLLCNGLSEYSVGVADPPYTS